MSCDPKAFGLALAVALVLSAALASSAWAEEGTTAAHLYSHEERTVLTGEQVGTNAFTIGSSSFTCPTATVAGTVTGEETALTEHQEETGLEGQPVYSATDVTVHPIYGYEEKVCQIKFGETNFGKMKVDTSGCTYNFGAHTTTTEPEEEGHAKVWVECESTGEGEETVQHEIKMTGPLGCTISIGTQGPLHGIRYENENLGTSEEAIDIALTVKGITYSATAACSLIGIGEHGEDLAYSGDYTVAGFEDEGFEASETPPFTEGWRIGIWWEPAEPTA